MKIDDDKVPEWAMKAAKEVNRIYLHGGFPGLTDNLLARIIAAHAPLDEAVKDGPWCDVCGGAIEFLCVNCDKKALERAQNG